MQKQIPTLLGIGVLLIGLVAGLLMFSGGTGVFAPRATPETTPKNIKVTNLTDKSFTVSFYTAELTAGFIKYGDNNNSLKSQASDDRDQLSGSVGQYKLHHITIRGLSPASTYHYVLGTGSKSEFDNNGVAFTVKTSAVVTGSPPLSKTVYGTVATSASAPAEGSVVYVSSPGMSEMSTLVKSSGSWAVALATARKSDGSGYADLTEESSLNVIVQGVETNQTALISTKVMDAQPVIELTLGELGAAVTSPSATTPPTSPPVSPPSSSTSTGLTPEQIANERSIENDVVLEATPIIDLTAIKEDEIPVTVVDPMIKGLAAPNVEVSIEIHSDNEIIETVTADANGNFSIDVAALQEQLDPGEHTVTYSYTDPSTGKLITETQNFIVEGEVLGDESSSRQIAQAGILENSETTFGSGNPVPLETPSPTPEIIEATDSGVSTRSAVVATDSGTYTAGSVGATFAMIAGGLFFIFAGWWSWWLANEAREVV